MLIIGQVGENFSLIGREQCLEDDLCLACLALIQQSMDAVIELVNLFFAG